jgi:hypothetical protein
MRPITHAVPGALIELLRGAPLSAGKVTFAWNAAVGPALERVSVVSLECDTLVVQTASAQWAREIRRSNGVILSRLQTLLGKDTVKSLSVRTKTIT